jgi:hypothetical protein
MLETDPQGWKLDDDGDLDVEAFAAGDFATGLEGVERGIASRIRLCRGEWFLDLDLGVPYFESPDVPASEAIIGQRLNVAYVRDVMARTITSAQGVTALLSLTVELDASTRELTVNWRTQTVFGEVAGTTEA